MLATQSAAVGFLAACPCWRCHQGFLELGFHQKGQFLARFCPTQRSRAHLSRRTQLTNQKTSVPYPAGSRKTFGNVMRALPESLKKKQTNPLGSRKSHRTCLWLHKQPRTQSSRSSPSWHARRRGVAHSGLLWQQMVIPPPSPLLK